ncbi:MAG TPA: DinB family protein [Candidatus Acidoferrum sp.]|nr:DinB family protein [Candidatus Acidoferrum sp.]
MTTPSDVLRSMFGHHVWATTRLIDALAQLDPVHLDARIEGTYGSTMQTLTHLVDADERYLRRLATPTLASSEGAETRPLADLRTEMREHGGRWAGMLDALERGALHAAVIRKSDYPDTDPAESMLLLQAIHHGNDHRTQVCSTLGASGLDVPDLDGWEYWASERR